MLLMRKRLNSQENALAWFRRNMVEGKGIIVHTRQRVPYPEVTGYFIPTLYARGETKLAQVCTNWLVSIQLPDGAFPAPDGKPYTFDTAQVMRGLCAAYRRREVAAGPLRRAADWMVTQVADDGRLMTPSTELWGDIANDLIHVYALFPMIEAAGLLGEPRYADAARYSLAYYLKQDALVPFNRLSHFHAYAMEALWELDEKESARRGMAEVEQAQRRDGAVPAYPGVEWTCSTGIAQYAAIWYRMGNQTCADRAMNYLVRIQNGSGGFFGSYGLGAKYIAGAEISWAVKYFLDAWALKPEKSLDA